MVVEKDNEKDNDKNTESSWFKPEWHNFSRDQLWRMPEFVEALEQHSKENNDWEMPPLVIHRLTTNNVEKDTREEDINNFFNYKEKKKLKVKTDNDWFIAYKAALGPTIRDAPGTASVLERAARVLGVPYEASDGTLRCPAGTPAANQFTNLQMTNCIVPSPLTIAGTARDAVGSIIDEAIDLSKDIPKEVQAASTAGAMANGSPSGLVNGILSDDEREDRRRIFEETMSLFASVFRKRRGRARTNDQGKKLFKDTLQRYGIDFDEKQIDEFFDYIPQLVNGRPITAAQLNNFYTAREYYIMALIMQLESLNLNSGDLPKIKLNF
jgi:hypothetical protein